MCQPVTQLQISKIPHYPLTMALNWTRRCQCFVGRKSKFLLCPLKSLAIFGDWLFFSPCSAWDGLIDTSLWWSDMIDFSCLSSRQVIFIYLPCLPLLLSCSLFLSHLLREFLEIIIFQYRTVSRLHTETRISHITSTAQSCNQNPLTFQKWWVRVTRRVK